MISFIIIFLLFHGQHSPVSLYIITANLMEHLTKMFL